MILSPAFLLDLIKQTLDKEGRILRVKTKIMNTKFRGTIYFPSAVHIVYIFGVSLIIILKHKDNNLVS